MLFLGAMLFRVQVRNFTKYIAHLSSVIRDFDPEAHLEPKNTGSIINFDREEYYRTSNFDPDKVTSFIQKFYDPEKGLLVLIGTNI